MRDGGNSWLAGPRAAPRPPAHEVAGQDAAERFAPPPAPGPPPLSLEQKRLVACVHCGFCLNACPTYTRLGDEADSPRGRIALMRAVAEGRLEGDDPAFLTHIDRCLGCRACETACPSGVEYGFLLERARAVAAATDPAHPPADALPIRVFDRPGLRRWTGRAGRALRAAGLAERLASVLPPRLRRARLALAMLAATRPWRGLTRADATGVVRGYVRGATGATGTAPARRTGPRVALLEGCVQDALFAHVNAATVRVLEAHGCTVLSVPGQGCCGALHAHAGALATARERARVNIDAFVRSGADFVVTNAAGCGAMLKEYGAQLERDAEWAGIAATFTYKVRDVFELLLELDPVPGAPIDLRYTYDAPCHLAHGQRAGRAPVDVLSAAIPELEHVPLAHADECCGGAGTYGLNHPELASRILDDKLDAIEATRADLVLTPNPGCIMQIGGGLRLRGSRVPVLHPIELLAESYRRAAFR